MTLRICHISDWHGYIPPKKMPSSDVYVCTGDMLRNYLNFTDGVIDKKREILNQGKYVKTHCLRDSLESRDAPVVVIRGNHEYVNLYQWVGGEVHEVGLSPETVRIHGYKFSGYRGVNSAGWSDDLSKEDDLALSRMLDEDIDFLVTHAPPKGIRDKIGKGHTDDLGLQGLASYIVKRMYATKVKPLSHFFGHIHESYGFESMSVKENGVDRRKFFFSNAATGYLNYSYKNGELSLIDGHKYKR